MGIFSKKPRTMDDFARKFTVQAHRFIVQVVKDIRKGKYFLGVPKEQIYTELLLFHFWSLKFVKFPDEIRNGLIKLRVKARNVPEANRQGLYALIEERSKEYFDAWGYDEFEGGAARAAHLLVSHLDENQAPNGLNELVEALIMAAMVSMVKASAEISLEFRKNA